MGADADAEALSITRLEGSRWRGGRLWSHELGSGSVKESEARPSALRIDARMSMSSVVDRAHGDTNARRASESTHGYCSVWAPVGWLPVLAARVGRHDVSKMKDTRASWCALRMGPRTIGAPQFGQDHAGVAGTALVSVAHCRSNRRASVSRAVRQ